MTEKTWEELKAMEPVKDHDGHIKDWLTKLYAAGDALKEKADRLDELLVIYKRHYGNVIEYALELQEKAEKWDSFFEKPEARVRAVELLLEAGKKLEAIKKIIDEPQPSLQQYEKIKKILEAEG